MKNLKSHFWFAKNNRNGILVLLTLIIFLQVSYFLYKYYGFSLYDEPEFNAKASVVLQQQVDSLYVEKQKSRQYVPKPYNPNFISDYKGYLLGMSVEEIDRLHEFRKKDQYVNSAKDFQKVTQVSDSLLKAMESYFKFPEWTQKKSTSYNNAYSKFAKKEEVIEVKDINLATKEALMQIKGIGDAYSDRILKRRAEIKGFLIDEQLYEVWGMDSLVIEKVLKQFRVLDPPEITKQDLNEISLKQLQKNPYVNYYTGVAILKYRSKVGNITTFDELAQLNNVPKLTLERLSLYFYLGEE